MTDHGLVKRQTRSPIVRASATVALPAAVVATGALGFLPVEHFLTAATNASATNLGEAALIGLGASAAAVGITEASAQFRRNRQAPGLAFAIMSASGVVAAGGSIGQIAAHDPGAGVFVGVLAGVFGTAIGTLVVQESVTSTSDMRPVMRRLAIPGAVTSLGLGAAIVVGHLLNVPIPDPALLGSVAVGAGAAIVAPAAASVVHHRQAIGAARQAKGLSE